MKLTFAQNEIVAAMKAGAKLLAVRNAVKIKYKLIHSNDSCKSLNPISVDNLKCLGFIEVCISSLLGYEYKLTAKGVEL